MSAIKRAVVFFIITVLIVNLFSACSDEKKPAGVSSGSSVGTSDKSDTSDDSQKNNDSVENVTDNDDIYDFDISDSNTGTDENTGNLDTVQDTGSPDDAKYANSKKIKLYSGDKFIYQPVISQKAESDVEDAGKTVLRIINRTSSVKMSLVTDDDKEAKSGARIFIGSINDTALKEIDSKLYTNDSVYDDYIITVKKEMIYIYSLSGKGLDDAVKFFNKTFLQNDGEHSIPENYEYIYRNNIKTNMKINGIDVSRYAIVTDKYPSRVVMAGIEEVAEAIKNKTDFEIPIVKTGNELNYLNKIEVKTTGKDYNAYSLSFSKDNMVISGGHNYSLNAALHRLASNISKVPDDKSFNIPNTFKYSDNYSNTSKTTKNYKLVLADEFDGQSLNKNNWISLDYPIATQGAGGGRYSFNVDVKDNMLNLKTSAEQKEDGMYYYGSGLNSKFTFQFGYAEIRAKINKGTGIFPSFWMCTDMTADKPFHPEIDVFEFFGSDYKLESQMHSWWNAGQQVNGLLAEDYHIASGHIEHLSATDGNAYTLPGNEAFSNDFHTFGCEWTPQYIKFSCDGVVYCTVNIESDLKDSYGAPLSRYMQFLNSDLRVSFWSNMADAQYGKLDENSLINTCYYIDYFHLYQQEGIGTFNPKAY